MTGKTIKCSNCGGSLDVPEGVNKIFCLYCGTPNLLTDVLEIPGVGLKCLSCGAKNKDEAIFCSKCGTNLQKGCPFCGEMHTHDTVYCFKTGRNIKEYEREIEKKQKTELEEFKKKLKKIIKELSDETNKKMVSIYKGTFLMGQKGIAEPVHEVTLSSFYIAIYEVTNREFCVFLNSQGNQDEGGVDWINLNDIGCGIISGSTQGTFSVKAGYENHPVVCVSWYGAVAYCNWLSEQDDLEKCYGEKNNRGNVDINNNGYRLPTEAEWECACRAGTTTEYYWDRGDRMNDDYCWHYDNSGESAHPVGKKLPNAWGLYDMSGNVWEWCSDWYGDYLSASVTNPVGSSTGLRRVRRGGCWFYDAHCCRSAYRRRFSPIGRYDGQGFRLASKLEEGIEYEEIGEEYIQDEETVAKEVKKPFWKIW